MPAELLFRIVGHAKISCVILIQIEVNLFGETDWLGAISWVARYSVNTDPLVAYYTVNDLSEIFIDDTQSAVEVGLTSWSSFHMNVF